VGERTHTTYRIGDVVRVKVARVDLDERKIDLELMAPRPGAGMKRSRTRHRKVRKKAT